MTRQQPAYLEISQWLRTVVAQSEPGALLPTIKEVGDEFDVHGVQTVINGYKPLIDEGLVERLDSPRRFAVVDRGQVAEPGPETGHLLVEAEDALQKALVLVREARRATEASRG